MILPSPQSQGAVIAALITGAVTFLSLLVTKEQKISEFRQAWIDALRNDLAELLSRVHVIADAHTAGVISADQADWVAVREDWIAANNAATRIKLRLNPEEAGSQAILALVKELDEGYVAESEANYELIHDVEERLVVEAHIYLKKEWKRVKRGELVYALVKYGSGLLVLGTVLFLTYTAVRG